jgi:hypothetical protein
MPIRIFRCKTRVIGVWISEVPRSRIYHLESAATTAEGGGGAMTRDRFVPLMGALIVSMLLPAHASGTHRHIRHRAYAEVRDGVLRLTRYATLVCQTFPGRPEVAHSVECEGDEMRFKFIDWKSPQEAETGLESDEPSATHLIQAGLSSHRPRSGENEDALEEAVFPQ